MEMKTEFSYPEGTTDEQIAADKQRHIDFLAARINGKSMTEYKFNYQSVGPFKVMYEKHVSPPKFTLPRVSASVRRTEKGNPSISLRAGWRMTGLLWLVVWKRK
jgi:hypothetical protein